MIKLSIIAGQPGKPKLTIIRGLPGAGKSTYAKENFSGSILLETDQYFYAKTGEYKYDYEKLQSAQHWCITTTRVLLRNGHDVVVSNSFTSYKNIRAYAKLAKSVGAELSVYTLETNYGSIHDLSSERYETMKTCFIPHDVMVEHIKHYMKGDECDAV